MQRWRIECGGAPPDAEAELAAVRAFLARQGGRIDRCETRHHPRVWHGPQAGRPLVTFVLEVTVPDAVAFGERVRPVRLDPPG